MSKKRPKVLLITPPYHSGVVESAGTWMPLNFVYLAGHARRAGAEVRIYDAMSLFHSHEQIQQAIEAFGPDIVATTAITAMAPDAIELCEGAKAFDPSIVTVLGNVHPTFCWEQILTDHAAIDLIVRGEGEHTLEALVGAVSAAGPARLPPASVLEKIDGLAFRKDGQPFSAAPRALTEALDSLLPAWDLIDWPHYSYRPSPEGRLAIVSSSRGCEQACSFCSQQKFWGRCWRGRDPLTVVRELEHLRDTHDVRVVMRSDETPTANEGRWKRLLELLVEHQVGVEILMETRVDDILRDEAILPLYVEAGISHIYVGVESANQATLDLFKKETKAEHGRRAIELINAHEMVSETSFVLGMPDQTAESVARATEIAIWYGPDMAFFLAMAPWPYADIYEDLAPYVATTDYRKYNLVEPVIKPTDMTLDEMRLALHRATGHFFKDKFERLGELSPKKQKFMVSVLKLLIEKSYLGKEMRAMAEHAEMPEAVRQMAKTFGITLPGS